MGFGNTVPPPKKDEDFLNSAMSSLYSVSPPPLRCPGARRGVACAAPPSQTLGVTQLPEGLTDLPALATTAFQVNETRLLQRAYIQ